MGSLSLPGLRLCFEVPEENACVLVAGGRPPAPWWLRGIGADRCLWAVDAGADSCRSAFLVPHLVVGDLDSVSSRTLEWLKKHRVPLERHSTDKDRTDFQLALDRWLLHPSRNLIVSGCWGGRFDHLWAVIHDCLRARMGMAGPSLVCLADEREAMVIMGEGDRGRLFPGRGSPPSILSLLPLSEYVKGVDLEGVRWPLRNATLLRELSYAVSNQPLWSAGKFTGVDVSLGEGWMGVYLAWGDVGELRTGSSGPEKNKEAGP